ncbi:MAG TPA: ATP-binding protein [Polyangiaceae bacterium]|nr:ATP-binding protein [Polyangiaceae bacterium]
MALGVFGVVVLGIWDERREARRALDELAREQQLIALALVTPFGENAPALPTKPALPGAAPAELSRSLPGQPQSAELAAQMANIPSDLRRAVETLENAGGLVILLELPEVPGFVSLSGRRFDDPTLERAAADHVSLVTLSRDAAALLGLPRRTSVAGLAEAPSGPVRGVVVLSSAGPLRDRGFHDQWRSVSSIGLVTALIVGFGLVALRQQRRHLALEQEIALRRTQQERDAELAKANRMAALAALASGIAHEIGTPLGIIAGRIEQLRGAFANDDRSQRLLGMVQAQVERIDKVVRSFLALARGESPALVRVAARRVAEDAEKLVQHRFDAAGVRLATELDDADEAGIACEPALFEQVLVNLLINALEASSSGQRVLLRVERREDQVAFAVVDEGSVISPALIARATEPFFTTKAKSGGSGLGLAISKEIIEQHRGTLSIQRRCDLEGEGTAGTRVEVSVPYFQGNPT